jgi:hypothetical protein
MERTPGAAEDRRFGAGARGRMQAGDFAVFVKRADETGAPRKTPRVIVRQVRPLGGRRFSFPD